MKKLLPSLGFCIKDTAQANKFPPSATLRQAERLTLCRYEVSQAQLFVLEKLPIWLERKNVNKQKLFKKINK